MAISEREQARSGSSPDSLRRHATLPPRKNRHTNVYDAVAGRLSSTGFLPTKPRVSKNRDTLSSSTVAVPPEEVLFRRKGAPVRYEEDDLYWADRHLKEGQTLPDSDLLKAVHTYASDFYARSAANRGASDFESLDETALMALGMLLEEMSGYILGSTGDLAFVEGEEIEEQEEQEGGQETQDEIEQKKRGAAELSTGDDTGATPEAADKRDCKRRKGQP